MEFRSIMFHHLHGSNHPEGQGSISAEKLNRIIEYLKQNYNLMCSHDFHDAAILGKLNEQDICLSFDDGLLCQYELALPVLESWSITAYFFICSKPITGGILPLQVFRYFRSTAYESVDEFYTEFFQKVANIFPKQFLKAVSFCNSNVYKPECEFYSKDDRLMRYFRDHCVSEEEYEHSMFEIMSHKGYASDNLKNLLWMNSEQITHLNSSGHCIGLHSHSHPTALHLTDYNFQWNEFSRNYQALANVLGGNSIKSVSYPCGFFNEYTLEIMNKLGIELGFLAKKHDVGAIEKLQLGREDHANILANIASE